VKLFITRLLVPLTVLGSVVALCAVPAEAAVVPAPAAATITSANPVDYTPQVQNGSVRAFAQIGNTIYAGGSFTGVKAAGASAWTPAGNLVAYDATTGALAAGFKPVFDDAVQALAVSPAGKLIVGGNFTMVNGVARKNLVAIDPNTGATITNWVGQADGGVVRRTVVQGNHLYVSGAFHYVNGTAHSLLARLNATTGAIDATFQIDASVARATPNSTELVWAIAVAPDGKTLMATGNFTKVNGLARNQVVMIEVSGTPTVANWTTDRYVANCLSSMFPFYARDVDFSDDGSYFVIGADGGDGDAYCDAIARFETVDRGAAKATWVNFTGRDSVTSIEATDGLVYVAGHFRWLNNANGGDSKGAGGVDRYGFGALDASNGMPQAWNPTRSPGTSLPAGGVEWGAIVWELWKGSNGLYAGFDSDGVAGEYHGRQAMFPTAGGRTIAVKDAPTAASGYLYLGAGNGKLTKVSFDGTTIGVPGSTAQAQFTSGKAAFSVSGNVLWAKGAVLDISGFSAGTVGAPAVASGFNAWFNASTMTGAFYLNGRMYYTLSGSNALYYRYLTTDGWIVGCTAFTLPTSGITWSTVRGMAWVNGKLVYGSADGKLRSVTFAPAAATAVAGASATVIATGTTAATWSQPTLFFATS
jgi:hypothetical protein